MAENATGQDQDMWYGIQLSRPSGPACSRTGRLSGVVLLTLARLLPPLRPRRESAHLAHRGEGVLDHLPEPAGPSRATGWLSPQARARTGAAP